MAADVAGEHNDIGLESAFRWLPRRSAFVVQVRIEGESHEVEGLAGSADPVERS
jgi:hypothetical protein